jgi:hypothetical protein
VDQYTHGEVNTAVAFLLLYLLRFIGMAVIQDKFNDMLDAGTVSSAPVAVEPAQPVPDTAAQNDTAPEPTTPAPAPADPPAEQTPPTETPTSPSSDQK